MHAPHDRVRAQPPQRATQSYLYPVRGRACLVTWLSVAGSKLKGTTGSLSNMIPELALGTRGQQLTLLGFHVENRGVRILEECRMQRAHCFIGIVFVNHEAHVDLARALRNHAYVNVTNRSEDLRGNSVLASNIFAHHTDECLLALVLHIGQLAQVRSD